MSSISSDVRREDTTMKREFEVKRTEDETSKTDEDR